METISTALGFEINPLDLFLGPDGFFQVKNISIGLQLNDPELYRINLEDSPVLMVFDLAASEATLELELENSDVFNIIELPASEMIGWGEHGV